MAKDNELSNNNNFIKAIISNFNKIGKISNRLKKLFEALDYLTFKTK